MPFKVESNTSVYNSEDIETLLNLCGKRRRDTVTVHVRGMRSLYTSHQYGPNPVPAEKSAIRFKGCRFRHELDYLYNVTMCIAPPKVFMTPTERLASVAEKDQFAPAKVLEDFLQWMDYLIKKPEKRFGRAVTEAKIRIRSKGIETKLARKRELIAEDEKIIACNKLRVNTSESEIDRLTRNIKEYKTRIKKSGGS